MLVQPHQKGNRSGYRYVMRVTENMLIRNIAVGVIGKRKGAGHAGVGGGGGGGGGG